MSVKHDNLDALISLVFWSQFEDYDYFIQSSEHSINERLCNTIREFQEDKIKRNLSDDEAQEFYEFHYEDRIHRLQNAYPFTVRKSTFLTLYSFFESELYRITTNLDKDNKLNEIDENGIFKYYLFLQDSFDFTISKSLEKRFINYNALRNHFAHNNHKIHDSHFKKIKQIQGVHLKELTEYDIELNIEDPRKIQWLDKELNELFLNDITEFFKILVNTLKENDDFMAVISH
jgi:hypothetical protein